MIDFFDDDFDDDDFDDNNISQPESKKRSGVLGIVTLFTMFLSALKDGTIKPQQVRQAVREAERKRKSQGRRRWGLTSAQIKSIVADDRNWADIAREYHIPILRVRYLKGR